MAEHRIATTPFASIYPHYVAKVERKGRSRDDVDVVIAWLTGYDAAGLQRMGRLDKLVDEVAKGKKMTSILRGSQA